MAYPLLIFLLSFGHFLGAVDIDADLQGNSYVVDRAGNALMKFSPSGDSVRSVSGYGSGELQFDGPAAVWARSGNDIYVADYNNHRIQRFNRTLDYITTIYTREDRDERRRFGYPRDIAVTRQGVLVVVDGENRRIVTINALGQVDRVFGDVNAGEGRLMDPSHIDVDGEDNIYVLDGARIVEFDPFGSFIRLIPAPFSKKPVAFSIVRDTLAVADSTALTLLDLKTGSITMMYEFPVTPRAFRYANGAVIAVEEKRVALYKGEKP